MTVEFGLGTQAGPHPSCQASYEGHIRHIKHIKPTHTNTQTYKRGQDNAF